MELRARKERQADAAEKLALCMSLTKRETVWPKDEQEGLSSATCGNIL